MNRNASIFENGIDMIANLGAGFMSGAMADRAYGIAIVSSAAVSLAFQQAKDLAGTDAKPVGVSRIWYRIGTPGPGVDWEEFNVVDEDGKASTVDVVDATSVPPLAGTASDDATVVVELMVDTMDINNGFNYLNCANADVIATSGARYPQALPLNPVQ